MSSKKRTFKDQREMPLSAISVDDMTWNKTGSWRNVRPYYEPKKSPCIAGCPAGENIQGYIALAKEKRYEEAVRLIWQRNPFPAICGRVCYHPCMDNCLRGEFDDAIFIPAIERFLGDYAIEKELREKPPEKQRRERIAVVGGGPSGLSCAYYLAKNGYEVTIFEAKEALGGVLRYGIPEYRLPTRILDAEIERILALGIKVKTGTVVGKDVSLEDLSEFPAYFFGIGLQRSWQLEIENEDAEGVMPGLEFLEAVNRNTPVNIGKRAIVVGGGNTAMDVARSALRMGVEVTVLYRRTRAEMPAIEDEVEEAAAEGADFRFLATPVGIITENGRVREVRCQEMELGEPDESGRRRPVPKEGAYFTLPTDALLVAVGERPDTEAFKATVPLSKGLIVADEFGRTSNSRIFAGGDVVTGASTVVNAVARGRVASELIHAELTGGAFKPEEEKKVVLIADVNTAYFSQRRRAAMPRLKGTLEKNGFNEVNRGLTGDQVLEEASRCFSCGVCDGCDNCWIFCPDVAIHRKDGIYTIDYDYCKGCLVCMTECPRGCISVESEGK